MGKQDSSCDECNSSCDECNEFMIRNEEKEETGKFSNVLLQGRTNLGWVLFGFQYVTGA